MTIMVSGRFRMPQRRLIGYLYSRHGRGWTIGMLTMTAALGGVAAITSDIRWGICALMLVFLVAPVIIGWLYLHFALDPDCAFNVLDHRLELSSDGVGIAVWPRRQADAEGDSVDKPEGEQSAQENEPEPVVIRRIRPDEIGKFTVEGDYVMVSFAKRGIMYVPLSAFVNVEEMQRFLTDISSGSVSGAHGR